jgi:hypothetical protein
MDMESISCAHGSSDGEVSIVCLSMAEYFLALYLGNYWSNTSWWGDRQINILLETKIEKES